MATKNHIRNPIEFGAGQLVDAMRGMGRVGRRTRTVEEARRVPLPAVRRIDVSDLRDVIARGMDDLGTFRTDVIFLCLIYPIAGLVLARAAFHYDMLPLLFPLASGFALVGPFAGVGLYELSRRREEGGGHSAAGAFSVIRAPAFGTIVVLGLLLFAVFLLWLVAAYGIFTATLGPEPPTSIGAFVRDVFMTEAGWAMIVVGIGVGFFFAVFALAIGVVSFPLLLDRDVGLYAAVATSVRAVTVNPLPMAVWGMIVAAGLVIGSLPALLGLVIVMPLLGHATWHLYRKVVPR